MGPVAIDDEPTQELPVITGDHPAHDEAEITAEVPVVVGELVADDLDGASGPEEGPARPGAEDDGAEALDDADAVDADAEPAAEPAPVRTIVIGDKDGLTADLPVGPAGRVPPPPVANKRGARLVFGDGVDSDSGAQVIALGGALVIGDPVDGDGVDAAPGVAPGVDADPDTAAAPPRTIVIGDKDDPDDPEIDPRIKARRSKVLRAAGLRRLRWVLVALGVVGLLLFTNLMLRSPLFDVREVTVTGTSYVDPADMDAIRQQLVGKPLVSIDLASVRRAVEANQWVRAVDVSRDWPHTIHIDILERRPVAFYPGDDGLIHLVDIDGRVLETLEGIPVGFVEVNGVGNSAGPGEDAPEPLLPAIRVANDLPDQLKTDVKVVRLVQEGVTLDLTAGGTILLGDTTNLREKLVAALAVRAQCPPGSYALLDVRVPSRPAVSPRTGCGGSLDDTKKKPAAGG